MNPISAPSSKASGKLLTYFLCKQSGISLIPSLPSHWVVKRLKNLAALNADVLPETTYPDHEISYLDISNVGSSGKIGELQAVRFADAPSRARRLVQDGDTILSTVRTYLKAIAFIETPPCNLVVSTGFAVLRPNPKVFPKYLFWFVSCEQFIRTVMANSVGVGYPAISPAALGCLRAWLPPLEEQARIARLLDRETAKIDALIAKRERLIELLEEKRAALITRAVTKGLDPNVPMKESDVRPVGEMPSHWQVRRNKWVFREVDEQSTTGSEELLSVSHLTGVTPRSEKQVYMFMAESNEGYKLCRPNDLAVNTMWAYMGAVGIVPQQGIVSPSYNVYRIRSARDYIPKYLDYLYRTPPYICEINRYSKGIWKSRLRLYPDAFFDICTLTPPPEEQEQIVEHIVRLVESSDRFLGKLRESIDALREYRTALISAAVTGKIDVRAAVTNDESPVALR